MKRVGNKIIIRVAAADQNLVYLQTMP
jgi:hypothetical protein